METGVPLRTDNTPATAPVRLPLYFAGILLFAAGPALYTYQLSAGSLIAPWYVPVLASVGTLFLLASLTRRRSVPSLAGAAVLAAVCAFEWFFLLVATKSPVYEGPAQIGRRVPAFQSVFADGSPITDADLARGAPTLLVFFRGRW